MRLGGSGHFTGMNGPARFSQLTSRIITCLISIIYTEGNTHIHTYVRRCRTSFVPGSIILICHGGLGPRTSVGNCPTCSFKNHCTKVDYVGTFVPRYLRTKVPSYQGTFVPRYLRTLYL